MSNCHAKVHTHVSNRASAKKNLEKKTVYNATLSNPFKISCPSVPINLQNILLPNVLSLVREVGDIRSRQRDLRRKKKRSSRQAGKRPHALQSQTDNKTEEEEALRANKRQKTSHDTTEDVPALQENPNTDAPEVKLPSAFSKEEASSAVLKHLTIGINAVTRALEAQTKVARNPITVSISSVTSKASPCITLVFICRADINPPLIYAHIPPLVAACNAVPRGGLSDPVKLIPLPEGSELVLAQALGLRRVAIIGIGKDCPGLEVLNILTSSVPILSASWLASTPFVNESVSLVPTHIKQTKTTAPKDMKAAKELRKKGRAEAKAKKKAFQKKRGQRIILQSSDDSVTLMENA